MLSLLIAFTLQSSPILCPVMGVPPTASAGAYAFGGVRIGFCCMACRNAFEADPGEVVKAARDKGIVFGFGLFDPVGGRRLEPGKSKEETADYKGVRYSFASAANRATFLADPEKFAKTPNKEARFCIGSKREMPSYAKAIGYSDFEGVRFYQCCSGCEATFRKDPASYAKAAAKAVRTIEPTPIEPDK